MKAGPNANDRMAIARMFKEGLEPEMISVHTKVRVEQVNIVIANVRNGSFKGPREAELAAVKAEPTSGQKAAATRAANKAAEDAA